MAEMIPIVKEACDAAGGPTALGKALGVKHSTFYNWVQVPANRVLKIEEATGISRHRLRPDIYPEEAKA